MSSNREIKLSNQIMFRNEMLDDRARIMISVASILHDILDNYECGDPVDKKLSEAINILCGYKPV